ncbi:hypothetical protein B4099_2251 [Heyndrickxia coagulans]|uniref:Uncharacterized protein n=1 Tax=Heyndrickxia coagulans TaxID=1398 RepID=A0A150JTG3_HEYCO|nr:hypothetical protein B4099_2251 [Heyndrickxia coagulans]
MRFVLFSLFAYIIVFLKPRTSPNKRFLMFLFIFDMQLKKD